MLSKGAIVVHTVESLDPRELDPWLRRWAADKRRRDPVLRRVPTTALAVASMSTPNALALYDAVSQLVPADEVPSGPTSKRS